jgi:hypothetical protein
MVRTFAMLFALSNLTWHPLIGTDSKLDRGLKIRFSQLFFLLQAPAHLASQSTNSCRSTRPTMGHPNCSAREVEVVDLRGEG